MRPLSLCDRSAHTRTPPTVPIPWNIHALTGRRARPSPLLPVQREPRRRDHRRRRGRDRHGHLQDLRDLATLPPPGPGSPCRAPGGRRRESGKLAAPARPDPAPRAELDRPRDHRRRPAPDAARPAPGTGPRPAGTAGRAPHGHGRPEERRSRQALGRDDCRGAFAPGATPPRARNLSSRRDRTAHGPRHGHRRAGRARRTPHRAVQARLPEPALASGRGLGRTQGPTPRDRGRTASGVSKRETRWLRAGREWSAQGWLLQKVARLRTPRY